ncbi:phage tail protein [Aeromonas veronii]|uniref:phage tail protein n=1 Tax=Aeromonas veronii TaxID=654 RepID=UPI003D1D2BAD
MSAIYFAITTHAGQAKIANALALGVPLKITHMAVGDGNGQPVTPNPAQTALVREQRRAPLNTLFQDPLNPAQLVAEQIIPENVGGWWIREVGLYDETGTLIAIANSPDTYKPLLSEGSGRTQTVRMVLIVSDTSAVELKIDPAVVLATRKYVDDVMKAHKESRDHPEATAAQLGLVRKATDDEAKLGQAIGAMMDAKNVADYVKEMIKQMFCGQLLYWSTATPPSWAISLAGQAINQSTDPLLYSRVGATAPDMRGNVARGIDNGRGIDTGRVLLSEQLDAIQQITARFEIANDCDSEYSILQDGTGAFSITNTGGRTGPTINDVSSPHRPMAVATFDSGRVARSATETRMRNVAWLPITMRG